MTTVLSSANPILSLLYEPESQLVIYALQQLNVLVDHYWAEIASAIPKIETLYEDSKFSERGLAAIVASKVFYHLDELDDALRYALGAGTLFDATSQQPDQYIQTIIQKSIDEYVRLRNLPSHDAEANKPIDTRLIAVIERLFDRCIEQREYRQVLGIAIESRRLDVVKRVIADSGNDQELLAYILELSNRVVVAKQFRTEVLQTLVALYRQHPSGKPDYISMCTCLQFLNDSKGVGEVLTQLVESDKDEDVLMAYQVAFDLQENQNQPFMDRVAEAVPKPAGASNVPAASAISAAATTTTETTPLMSSTSDDIKPSASSADAKLTNLHAILSGTTSTQLYLSFLYKHNATDLNILRQLKDKLEARNSVTHNAAVIAHGLMHVGTTVDTFLRENLEWLGKAQNWAKFTATASLGVIHKGHTSESLKLLEPYLPNAGSAAAAAPGGSGGSVYQEGGALFALGLIHGQSHTPTLTYLMEALRNAGSNEIVQHGACLGVGLAGMATQNRDVFEALKGIVMSESAVAGEAAGYAMGLVLLGGGTETAGDAIEEMLAYAHDTQHEKIIRGLAIGIALICYGQEEQADTTIEQLVSDKDGILRYGGCFAIALAYAGTSNNSAIQKLLHIAVTDVEDEVRRAAVTALGFVLANQPQQVPRVVQLLAESYNPHVRYGACMAVGIACAGGPASCRKEALDVLEPLLRDRVDLVRQAALIATSMVLIQHNEKSEPRLQTLLRKTITDTMAVKADTMTKLGAELATGIVDAGGRNVTLALLSQTGHKRMSAIAGMVLFTQFWYWYPLSHFLALSFTPTAVIGLNKDLNLPEPFSVISLAPPSEFAYPPMIDLKKAEEKKEVKHATLSVTDKAKRKAASKESGKMDVEEEKTPSTEKTSTSDTTMKAEETKEGNADSTTKDEKSAKDKPEGKYQVLNNPARVTRDQEAKLHARPQQRYIPIKRHLGGIVLLKDTQPDKPEQLVTNAKPTTAVPGVGANEPAPPAPFEYRG